MIFNSVKCVGWLNEYPIQIVCELPAIKIKGGINAGYAPEKMSARDWVTKILGFSMWLKISGFCYSV